MNSGIPHQKKERCQAYHKLHLIMNPNYLLLKREVATWCSAMFSYIQGVTNENSTRSISASNPVTMENRDKYNCNSRQYKETIICTSEY